MPGLVLLLRARSHHSTSDSRKNLTAWLVLNAQGLSWITRLVRGMGKHRTVAVYLYNEGGAVCSDQSVLQMKSTTTLFQ